MEYVSNAEAVNRASLAHVSLLDEFIQVTEARMRGQSEPFVRESLGDMLESLRAERDGYIGLLSRRERARAA